LFFGPDFSNTDCFFKNDSFLIFWASGGPGPFWGPSFRMFRNLGVEASFSQTVSHFRCKTKHVTRRTWCTWRECSSNRRHLRRRKHTCGTMQYIEQPPNQSSPAVMTKVCSQCLTCKTSPPKAATVKKDSLATTDMVQDVVHATATTSACCQVPNGNALKNTFPWQSQRICQKKREELRLGVEQ